MSAQREQTRCLADITKIGAFTVTVALVAVFLVGSELNFNLMNRWLILTLAALGFYMIFCVSGRFAFSQTLMMSISGYSAAYFSQTHGFWLCMGFGVAVSGVFSFTFGLLMRKAQGFVFAIASLGVVQMGSIVLMHWTAFTGINGLTSDIPFPTLFGRTLNSEARLFWLFLGAVVVSLLVCSLIARSPLTRDVIATRDAAHVARGYGVPTQRAQLGIFTIGSMLGGLSGALSVFWQGSIGPDSFGLEIAIGLLLMPLIGGVQSIWGPVLGALFYVMLPRALSGTTQYAPLAYGVVLVIIVICLPGGFLSIKAVVTRSLRGHRIPRADPADTDMSRGCDA